MTVKAVPNICIDASGSGRLSEPRSGIYMDETESSIGRHRIYTHEAGVLPDQ